MIIAVSGKINSGKDEVGRVIQYLTDPTKNDFLDYKDWLIINDKYCDSIWEIKKFADKLKDIICIILSCTREQLEDREFKEKELGKEWWYYQKIRMNYGSKYEDLSELLTIDKYNLLSIFDKGRYKVIKLTPRKLFTLLGTDCGRNLIHPNIWINSMFTEYKPFSYSDIGGWSYPNWIITDLRFKNELKFIKDRKGITIRINKSKIIRHHTNPNTFNDEIFDENNKIHVDLLKGENLIYPEHISETELDNEIFDYYIQNDGTLDDLVLKVKEILLKEKIINEA